MNHYHRIFSLLPFVCLLVLFSGCGPGGPALQYVEGVVTLDGKPVEDANISFAPKQVLETDNDNGPLLAGGQTDANGRYKLSTSLSTGIDKGTTVGEYVVTIVKKRVTNPPTGPGQQMGRPIFEYTVPRVFENSDDSKITVTVVKGKNTFNFDLKSDGTFEVTNAK